MWFRKKDRHDPRGRGHRETPMVTVRYPIDHPAPPPSEYAVVRVGDVLDVPGCQGFADEIDPEGLRRLEASIDGIEEQDVVGTITRPEGGLRWEPHPLFADVGVRRIKIPPEDIDLVVQPDPARPGPDSRLRAHLDGYESELEFRLEDLPLPDDETGDV